MVNEQKALIGKQGRLNVEDNQLTIIVTIEDIRQAYGRIDYKVRPVNGSGQKWVDAGRVRLQ